MSRHVYLVLALALMVAGYSHPSPGLARGKAISAPLRPVFEDGLETAMGWRVFEEVVGEDPCYGRGIGSATRSQDVAYRGDYSLLIWANQARSLKSNHLIAYKRISDHGRAGTWRYQVHAYIAPGTANAGQTGPEFSIQNTRLSPAQQLSTAPAGIQYIANSESAEYGHWNLWRGVAAGSAAWQTFITQTLAADTWYTLTLEADYTNNTYQSF
jgi:hypothetical protein